MKFLLGPVEEHKHGGLTSQTPWSEGTGLSYSLTQTKELFPHFTEEYI